MTLEELVEGIIAPKLSKVNRLFSIALSDKHSTVIDDLRERTQNFYRICRGCEDFTVEVIGLESPIEIPPTTKLENVFTLYQVASKNKFIESSANKMFAEKLMGGGFNVTESFTKADFTFDREFSYEVSRRISIGVDVLGVKIKHIRKIFNNVEEELSNIIMVAERISADLIADM